MILRVSPASLKRFWLPQVSQDHVTLVHFVKFGWLEKVEPKWEKVEPVRKGIFLDIMWVDNDCTMLVWLKSIILPSFSSLSPISRLSHDKWTKNEHFLIMTQSAPKRSRSIDNHTNSVPSKFEAFLTVTSVTGQCYISTFYEVWMIRKSGPKMRKSWTSEKRHIFGHIVG